MIAEKPEWLEAYRGRLADATDEALRGSNGANYLALRDGFIYAFIN